MPRKVVKRKASEELIAHPSPFHSSVTIYEASTTSEPQSGLRRSKRVRVKQEAVDEDLQTAGSSSSLDDSSAITVKTEVASTAVTVKARRSASPRKPKLIPQALDVPHPAPARWREAYDRIKHMRESIVAPVDTMGCEQAQFKETDPKNRRYATLVSLMLSSQTKDEVTDAAMTKLRDALGGSISIDAVLRADDSTISGAIAKVGFWRRKTQYIKQAAQKLRDEFDSDVPKTVDELCSLPGVGPKMAFLALHVAWNINVGIGVDVHVHRITNRLGWHKPPTKTPEQTRLNLQSWLPIEFHHEINHRLVGFGQTICLPVAPRCDQCELSGGLCPSARKVIKKTQRKTTAKASTADQPQIEIKLEDTVTETTTPIPPSPKSE